MTLDWKSFVLGGLASAALSAALFVSVVKPANERVLAASAGQAKAEQFQNDLEAIKSAAASHDAPVTDATLENAVYEADAVLGAPGDQAAWEKLPVTQRAAVDLASLQVQVTSERHQLEAYDTYVKTLQNQARMVEADAKWQAVVRQNQQQAGSADDPMVTLLNVIRPGLGTVVKKLQTAAAQQGAPE